MNKLVCSILPPGFPCANNPVPYYRALKKRAPKVWHKRVLVRRNSRPFFRLGDRSLSAENITVSGISGRYATALFDLASDVKQFDAVAADLTTIKSMLAESNDLVRLVRSPLISRQDQAKAMAAVLEKLGVSDLVRRFVGR